MIPVMADTEQYEPNATPWVREQLEKIDRTGDTRSVSVMDRPVVVVIMTGAKTGKPRRVPLMRVEHEGSYAAVASKGGAPEHPVWFNNLVANPDVTVQDGTEMHELRARRLEGDERAQWWERAVAAYPPYAEYQTKTEREIPVFVLEPR
jgi:deazaflavin-dependent oxidoreductase (nitroreductase family)